MAVVQKIAPCLWFDTQAQQAAEFYVSVFDDAEVTSVSRYPDGAPERGGQVLTVEFTLQGQRFTALNGGPQFTFSEAVSFQIACVDQAETDRYWDALTDGGEESQCGWLKDRFGVSWQVVPDELSALLSDPDPGRAGRAMQAMLGMKRLDIAAMRAAADG